MSASSDSNKPQLIATQMADVSAMIQRIMTKPSGPPPTSPQTPEPSPSNQIVAISTEQALTVPEVTEEDDSGFPVRYQAQPTSPLDSLRNAATAMMRKEATMSAKYHDVARRLKEAEKKHDMKDQRINELVEERAKLLSSLQSQEGEIKKIAFEAKSVQLFSETLKTEYSKLLQDFEQMSLDTKQMQGDVSCATVAVDAVEKGLDQLTENVRFVSKELDQERAARQCDNNEAAHQISALSQALSEQGMNAARKSEELAHVLGKLAEKSSRLGDLEDQLTTTGEELTKLKQELAERDEMFAALHQDIDKKSEDIDKLRSEIADWQTIGETGKLSLDKVSAELQVAQQQVTEQQARLLQVEADRDAFHRQLMDLNSKTADMVASKDREIRKLNTEKEDLVSKLAASTRELDDTKAQWKRTQLDLERSNTEIASLKLEQEICAEESAQTKLELATMAAELKALQSAPKRTPTPIPRRTASPVREEPEQAPEQDERDTGKPPAMPITSTPTKRTLYRKGTHANAVDDEQPTDEEGKRGSRHEKKSRTESSSQAALTARKQAASSQRSRALDVTSRASPKVEEETPRKGPRTKKSPSSSKHHQKPSKSDDNGGDIFACDITDT